MNYMLTRSFCEAVAKRIFTTPVVWSSRPEIGLGTTSIKKLTTNSTLFNVGELPTSNGYSRAMSTIAGWQTQAGVNGPEAYLDFPTPTFTNTGGTDWPRVQTLFLVSSLDAGPELCGAWPIQKIVLPPGDSINFSRLILPWLFRAGTEDFVWP